MDDLALMRRAMELAARGRGRVEPNPMVGCVLARDGHIIGEGYHEYFGGPHAEPNALASCDDPSAATAYVTLEPCCHRNKKTPPCAPALIAAKISRVVAACKDENPAVAGKGLQMLRDAGVAVESGLLNAESRQMNAAYSKLTSYHQPYVTLKWAQTADGKIAGAGGKRMAISGAKSLELVHQLRSRCDAILVGIGTVLADDPLLTARIVDPPRHPVRIVLDSNLRIPIKSQLVQSARQSPVWVYCSETIFGAESERVSALRSCGVNVASLTSDRDGKLSLEYLLDELGIKKFTHLLVEPGPTLARSFIRRNLSDRVWVFRSEMRAATDDAPAAVKTNYPQTKSIALDRDILTEHLNAESPAFFMMQGSVDLPDPER